MNAIAAIWGRLGCLGQGIALWLMLAAIFAITTAAGHMLVDWWRSGLV